MGQSDGRRLAALVANSLILLDRNPWPMNCHGNRKSGDIRVDAAQIREFARVAIGLGGTLSIWLGYKLFCNVPSGIGKRRINAILGALLTVFGMGILTTDVRGIGNNPATQSVPVHKTKPANGGSHHKVSAEWFV